MIHNRVRIVDVADALGLSTATVSKKELVSACKKTIDFAVSEHNSFIYSLFIWQQEVV